MKKKKQACSAKERKVSVTSIGQRKKKTASLTSRIAEQNTSGRSFSGT
jgi:hypothetical protein